MPDSPYNATGQVAGNQCSSTYEGRHVSILESLLTHPTHADGFVDGGDPCVFGDVGVGVAHKSAAAATEYMVLDTEGIWWQSVVATNEAGDIAVAIGDELFINESTCIISKNYNKNTHRFFGYALTAVPSGTTVVIPVKVHFDPDDAIEQVGTSAAPYTNAVTGMIFREYRYASTSVANTEVRGIYVNLDLNGAQTGGGEALRPRTRVNAVLGGGVHGMHAGVEFGAAGEASGLAVGARATMLMKNAAHAGGTVAGGMSELYAAGALTDWSGATEHSIHRFVNDGEATGKATAQNVFSFAGLSATQNQAHNAWVAGLTRALRVVVDGVVYYVGLSNAP